MIRLQTQVRGYERGKYLDNVKVMLYSVNGRSLWPRLALLGERT
jgi:hypothetical protein